MRSFKLFNLIAFFKYIRQSYEPPAGQNFYMQWCQRGIAEKELLALLARDLLFPIVHNTTYEELHEASPLPWVVKQT
jgi:hypothetical protein